MTPLRLHYDSAILFVTGILRENQLLESMLFLFNIVSLPTSIVNPEPMSIRNSFGLWLYMHSMDLKMP